MWMLFATRGGDGWLWSAIGIALLLSGDPQRFHAVEAGVAAVAIGILIFHKIKRVVDERGRKISGKAALLGVAVVTRDRFSFPSGHSTTAFAVAITLGSYYPEALPLLLLLAANVAISRVIVGMHFLSDVLVGSAMGSLLGYVAFQTFAHYGLA